MDIDNFRPNRIPQQQENNQQNLPSIVIPAVKADFQDNVIFTRDIFLMDRVGKGNLAKEDPRNAKQDGERKLYPKIEEEDGFSYTGNP